MVLYTQGLEYDDRIRKEILSITGRHPEITFEIFAVTPKNAKEDGKTEYGVTYHIPFLKSREKYKSGTHTLAKAYDFYKTVAPELKRFDAVWCADIETFLFPSLLSKRKPLIWDLHELPAPFMRNRIMRNIFKFLAHKCTLMYHANESRIDCLRELDMISSNTPNIAIRNYPQKNLVEEQTPAFEKMDEFKKWRNGRKCIYLQGVSSMIRRPIESVSAIMDSSGFCGVVVGGYPEEAMKAIREKYSEKELNEKIFFAGKVPQIQTKNFIAECVLGLVFYQTNSLNNTYCEPNRMFQTIIMGKPVVVGCNPPMKSIVGKYNAGIALNSDGGDVEEIKSAISEIDTNYYSYRQNTEEARTNITWEAQEDLLVSSFISALN